MKKRIKNPFAFLVCVLVSISFFAPSTTAVSINAEKASALADSILDYTVSSFGEKNIQSLINGALTKNAGTLSEWYIFSLVQYDKGYDFTAYRKALEKYIAENDIINGVTREKYALLLAATGYKGDYVTKTLENSTGSLGLMSYIFALHLTNNGYVSNKLTSPTVAQSILTSQLSDGGWAVTGTSGDVDVTAMAVQALACVKDSAKIKNAVNKAISFLSSRLSDKCRYSSYSVENSESISQVIIALSSAGIDPCKDKRFIKNGTTLLDSLQDYRLSDGSYSHTAKPETNLNATVQALCAFVAYDRFLSGKEPFYILGKTSKTPAVTKAESKTTAAVTVSEKSPSTEKEYTKNSTKPHSEITPTTAKVKIPAKDNAAATDKTAAKTTEPAGSTSLTHTETNKTESTTKAVQKNTEKISGSKAAQTTQTTGLESSSVTDVQQESQTDARQNIHEHGENRTVYIIAGVTAVVLTCAGGYAYLIKRRKNVN